MMARNINNLLNLHLIEFSSEMVLFDFRFINLWVFTIWGKNLVLCVCEKVDTKRLQNKRGNFYLNSRDVCVALIVASRLVKSLRYSPYLGIFQLYWFPFQYISQLAVAQLLYKQSRSLLQSI